MSDAARRVKNAARDARSTDDLVDDGFGPMVWDENDMLASPLDKETLDEQASTQMGEMWESRRRDAD
jgi:hypothetical protein